LVLNGAKKPHAKRKKCANQGKMNRARRTKAPTIDHNESAGLKRNQPVVRDA